MANPLSPSSLQTIISSLIPADTSLSNATTVIALLVHAIHTALGFRQVKPAQPAVPDGETASSDPKERNKLSAGWLERCTEDESFAISYRHEQSSLLFEIRIHRLGNRLVVNAVAVEDNKTATVDIVAGDYISRSALPRTLTDESGLGSTFNSPNRLTDFISLYKIQVIQKLIPGLVKPGYTEEKDSSQARPPQPPAAGPSQTTPQRGEPEYPDRGGAARLPTPGGNPLEIGRSDLDPLGGTTGRLPGAGGDGMFVGPGHPLFNRERQQNDPLRIPGTGGGPWGGDGYLPPLGAPPGARFDPIAPFGPGGTPGLGQPARRNWGDELPPPGFDNELGGGGQFNPLNPGGGGGFGGLGGPPRGGGAGGGYGNMFM